MEQHPIPQDVTGFQFKLIGSMTVKQFGYVAAGVISAVMLYYFPLSGAFGVLFKLLFVPLLGASGAIIAFIPIEGRPIDVMAGNFMKAIVSPNQYVYIKRGKKLAFLELTSYSSPAVTQSGTSNSLHALKQKKTQHMSDIKEQQLQQILHGSNHFAHNKLDDKEGEFLKMFAQAPTPTTQQTITAQAVHPQPAPVRTFTPIQTHPQPAPVQPPISNNPQSPQEEVLEQKESVLVQEILQAKKDEKIQNSPEIQTQSHQKALVLENQLKDLHAQKSKLEEEVARLKNQLSPAQQPQAPAPAIPVSNAVYKTNAPYIPDTPNVLVGIIRDPRGNVLPSILVEVKDKEGNPIRAFKTNGLGQFASATPLSPGMYTIEFEDPKKLHMFEVIRFSVNNQIMPPIEVTSHDAREALRKQLFN